MQPSACSLAPNSHRLDLRQRLLRTGSALLRQLTVRGGCFQCAGRRWLRAAPGAAAWRSRGRVCRLAGGWRGAQAQLHALALCEALLPRSRAFRRG